MSFYQRNLPHWQPDEAEYFITFRLAGSLPKEAITNFKSQQEKLKDKNEIASGKLKAKINRLTFQKYENLLEENNDGPH